MPLGTSNLNLSQRKSMIQLSRRILSSHDQAKSDPLGFPSEAFRFRWNFDSGEVSFPLNANDLLKKKTYSKSCLISPTVIKRVPSSHFVHSQRISLSMILIDHYLSFVGRTALIVIFPKDLILK